MCCLTFIQEVRRKHHKWLRNNRHLRYMWIPYTDAVVVVTNNIIAEVSPCAGIPAYFLHLCLAMQAASFINQCTYQGTVKGKHMHVLITPAPWPATICMLQPASYHQHLCPLSGICAPPMRKTCTWVPGPDFAGFADMCFSLSSLRTQALIAACVRSVCRLVEGALVACRGWPPLK